MNPACIGISSSAASGSRHTVYALMPRLTLSGIYLRFTGTICPLNFLGLAQTTMLRTSTISFDPKDFLKWHRATVYRHDLTRGLVLTDQRDQRQFGVDVHVVQGIRGHMGGQGLWETWRWRGRRLRLPCRKLTHGAVQGQWGVAVNAAGIRRRSVLLVDIVVPGIRFLFLFFIYDFFFRQAHLCEARFIQNQI